MNGYAFVYDRQIAPPAWGRAFVVSGRLAIPLRDLDRDIFLATLLPGSQGVSSLRLANHVDGTGMLSAVPAGPLEGRHGISLAVRYSDGIQHVDAQLTAEVGVPRALAITFTDHGTVRIDFPARLAVTPALTSPDAYRIEPLDGASAPLAIQKVGREERRADPAGVLRAVSDPTYVELFVVPATTGQYRLTVPVLRTLEGGLFGPASGDFTARLVKRAFAVRTIGPKSAHGHELAPGVVLSALFAQDERSAGRGSGGERG